MLTKLSLFTGIGGDDLASEWAGIKTICHVEINLFCQQVLKRHWPNTPIIGDIHTVTKEKVKEVSGYDYVDIIGGGFPCQDISIGNTKGEGLNGSRSGLWYEFSRVVSAFRPKYFIVENVSNLINRGFYELLGDISTLGYDAQWGCIEATAVGAPHKRQRIFIVAYPNSLRQFRVFKEYDSSEYRKQRKDWQTRFQTLTQISINESEYEKDSRDIRMCDGIPDGLDRLKAIGNSVVPQQIYPIYKAIAQIEGY